MCSDYVLIYSCNFAHKNGSVVQAALFGLTSDQFQKEGVTLQVVQNEFDKHGSVFFNHKQ